MKIELTHEVMKRMVEKLGCRQSLEVMVCLLELPDGFIREEDEAPQKHWTAI